MTNLKERLKDALESKTQLKTEQQSAVEAFLQRPSTSRHNDRCADVQTRMTTYDTYADAVDSRSPSNSGEQLNSRSPRNTFI